MTIERVAIHENYEVIRIDAIAVDRTQDQANCHPFARLVLADKHELCEVVRNVLRMGFDERPDDQLVIGRPGADIERCRDLLAADLSEDRADDALGDCRLLVIGRHLDMQAAGAPARLPDRIGARAHARPFELAIDLGPHRVGEPPAKAPDAERADDEGHMQHIRLEEAVVGRDEQIDQNDHRHDQHEQLSDRPFPQTLFHRGAVGAETLGQVLVKSVVGLRSVHRQAPGPY